MRRSVYIGVTGAETTLNKREYRSARLPSRSWPFNLRLSPHLSLPPSITILVSMDKARQTTDTTEPRKKKQKVKHTPEQLQAIEHRLEAEEKVHLEQAMRQAHEPLSDVEMISDTSDEDDDAEDDYDIMINQDNTTNPSQRPPIDRSPFPPQDPTPFQNLVFRPKDLPPPDQFRRRGRGVKQAYRQIYALYEEHKELTPPRTTKKTAKYPVNNPLVCIRLLGLLLIHAPTKAGCITAAREISLCQGDLDTLLIVAERTVQLLMRCFKVGSRGPTPTMEAHPLRTSFDDDVTTISREMKSPSELPESVRQKILYTRQKSLCPIAAEKCPHFEVAHIIPWSINSEIDKPGQLAKMSWGSNVWAFLKWYGDIDPSPLQGNGINDPSNLIGMALACHRCFDRLELWLTPMDPDRNPHLYNLGLHRSVRSTILNLSKKTDMADIGLFDGSPRPERTPIPNPKYLALHAAVCKIFNDSGAVWYVNSQLEHATSTMAEDGSSAWLLAQHLQLIDKPRRPQGRPA
ncbi:hypothetical protein SISNIDRAFT_483149 [Sistotremastrum niveocremeum HHB9708]|uniref:HNH nuclease domain-containing protein n=1 Tax=Sistotremastrum niveocremeum HHB9708 TaxID=1314777 RepID=A0A164Y5B4_9AGAM|nr:hypothetical protein SISNIDRAFT_483149 [Sistotremastrum niveocremeum HHB9708]